MERRFGSKRSQAPRYPTLHEGRKLLLAGILGLSGCGITELYEEPLAKVAPDAGHDAADAGELLMGVAPEP